MFVTPFVDQAVKPTLMVMDVPVMPAAAFQNAPLPIHHFHLEIFYIWSYSLDIKKVGFEWLQL